MATGSGSELSGAAREIAERLRRATRDAVGAARPVTLLFSGGLDSSLIAWFARDLPGVELLTVGRPDSPDLQSGASAAVLLGAPWRGRTIDDEMFRTAVDRWESSLGPLPEPRRSVLWALGFAFLACGSSRALLGQGADELFGGYSHFEGLRPSAAVERSESDWRRLIEMDWPSTQGLAGEVGLTVSSPYLDGRVSGFVRSLPVASRGFGGARKALLQEVARVSGLPAALVERPKRAMQYGTRIARDLKRFSASARAPSPRGSGSRRPREGPD
ncbi:MAG: asparagine synthase C-terminal domain-containing protein [Thermoplasmata archaeon]|nr:asparagine synthase C-terminal domain-containing protein [Thermoplasmata archaeon]